MISKDYHGYHVYEDGTVIGRRLGRPLGPRKMTGGYVYVSLWFGGKQHSLGIHRLLAILFIPNPENKPTVDHIDRIITNNCLSNLRWATVEEQLENRGMYSNNTSGIVGVHYNKSRDRWIAQLKTKGIHYSKSFKTKEVAIAQRLSWENLYLKKI